MDEVTTISTTTLLLLVPIVLIEFGIMLVALIDLIRRKRVKGSDRYTWAKWAWGALVIFVSFIGPIVYLVAGREED